MKLSKHLCLQCSTCAMFFSSSFTVSMIALLHKSNLSETLVDAPFILLFNFMISCMPSTNSRWKSPPQPPPPTHNLKARGCSVETVLTAIGENGAILKVLMEALQRKDRKGFVSTYINMSSMNCFASTQSASLTIRLITLQPTKVF